VKVPVGQLISKPAGLSWPAAGAMYVVGVTAYAAVRAVSVKPGDTVAVSAAAGGVGAVTVQLLKTKGANVIGIASEANHAWLTSLGVTPVAYGDGLADRLRAAAPDGIDAFIDLFGPDYVKLAVELAVARDRIETIIAYDAAKEYGTQAAGSGDATTTEVLAEMTELVASGQIEIPIAATYPLDEVQQAFTRLAKRHTRGKIVLIP
jgi:NADPH:quinone reductase